jgi:SAM-dependent methyltransferase
MLKTREEARRYPLGDLRLLACRECGFISNVEFSYEMQGEIDAYETAQGFSARFSAYQHQLCVDLAGRHDLRGRRVVEIGCGSGDFLRTLCEVADCSGVGYDPTLADVQVTHSTDDACQFVKAAFAEAEVGTAFDLLVCRHTLEHMAAPGELVRLCRAASRASGESPVFFEVPDVARILENCAFWDIYYEHCSYFSMGSLARLFRRCGFEILDLERVYDDQYLLITARPADRAASEPFAQENDLEQILTSAASFKKRSERILADWRDRLQRAAQAKAKVALWGSGSKAAGFLATLGIREQIPYIVDINPRKQGLFQAGTGQEIAAPERLREYRPDLLVIMNASYRDEIEAVLRHMDLEPEILAL